MKKRVKELLDDADKKTLTVYFILRFLVLITLIIQVIHQNWQDVFLCFLTLILFCQVVLFLYKYVLLQVSHKSNVFNR